MRPNITKKICYTILNGEFKLHNFESMFAQMVLSKMKGTHYFYSNHEAKADIDIDKILIENYCDTEEYRMVLFPGFGLNTKDIQNNAPPPDTMIKIRARDKFVVVREAPWRVFDQFEVFIYPTSIQFTHNFYTNFKNFIFGDNKLGGNVDNSVEEEKKLDLLVP